MAVKPFDTSLKELIEADPLGWATRFCGGSALGATVIDGDVATVTAAADKVIRVTQPGAPCLLEVEAQSSHDSEAPDRLLFYSTVLSDRHGMPVRSVLILLRPDANATAITGTLEKYHRPPGQREGEEPYLVFRYEVVRLWEEPVESLLNGPAALAALAPLTDAAAADLQGTVYRAATRLREEPGPGRTDKMEAAMYLLLGLRYSAEVIDAVFQGVQDMENSSTYQAILRRGQARGEALGEARGVRDMLLLIGRKKFGEPDAAAAAGIEQIADVTRLRSLAERVYDVSSWQELLA